jgi:hypothetical protein
LWPSRWTGGDSYPTRTWLSTANECATRHHVNPHRVDAAGQPHVSSACVPAGRGLILSKSFFKYRALHMISKPCSTTALGDCSRVVEHLRFGPDTKAPVAPAFCSPPAAPTSKCSRRHQRRCMRANPMMLDNTLGGTVGTCQTGFRDMGRRTLILTKSKRPLQAFKRCMETRVRGEAALFSREAAAHCIRRGHFSGRGSLQLLGKVSMAMGTDPTFSPMYGGFAALRAAVGGSWTSPGMQH